MQPQRYAVGVLPIQLAVASASPSSWEDAIVVDAGTGWVEIVAVANDQHRVLVTTARAEFGEPVAVHPIAELISVGVERHTAR